MRTKTNYIIGLIRGSLGSLGKLLADPFGMGLLTNLVDNSLKRALLKVRKKAFEKMKENDSYQQLGKNIIIMKGAKPNETELQTAEKLAKTDEFYIIFPNDGQIEEIKKLTNESGKKKNDLYLVDKITYRTMSIDIKTCGNPSQETIIAHLSNGVNQAPNLILDITGKISKVNLIKGLRHGWSNNMKIVLLNYHGQWYLLNRERVYEKEWLEKMLR